MSQLNLFSTSGTIIPTIRITPNKEMPLEVFRELYKFSAFAELMERTPEGHVIWSEDLTEIWATEMPDVVYHMIQNGWIECTLEVPKEWVDKAMQE